MAPKKRKMMTYNQFEEKYLKGLKKQDDSQRVNPAELGKHASLCIMKEIREARA